MHGTVIGHGSEDYNRRCYKISMRKTGHIITRTKKHVMATSILRVNYHGNELMKCNKNQKDNKVNELLYKYTIMEK